MTKSFISPLSTIHLSAASAAAETKILWIKGFKLGRTPPLDTRKTSSPFLVATRSISFLTGQASASTYIFIFQSKKTVF